MKRLFLALPLSDAAAARLWTAWEPLRISSRQIRWITPDQFHITLVFLGDTGEELIPDIVRIMEDTGARYSEYPIISGGADHFPPSGHPRVLFESLREGVTRTATLQRHLARELSSLAELEKRKFHPHITMARIKAKNYTPPSYSQGIISASVSDVLRELVLYESVLTPSGAVYYDLHRTKLLSTKGEAGHAGS
jgi:2'-5' RNA ligase